MKTRNVLIILVIAVSGLLPINKMLAQQSESLDEVVVSSGPPRGILVKPILVINGVLINDSILGAKLTADLKSYKTKTKHIIVTQDVAREIGLNSKYAYFFQMVEVKNVIFDPQTMKLIKIK